MQDRIAALYSLFYSMRVSNVALNNFKFAFNICTTFIKPTPRIERIIKDKGADLESLANQGAVKCEPIKPSAPVTRMVAELSMCDNLSTPSPVNQYA